MGMQFDTFCAEVLDHIPRATRSEQEQIREELLGHLEDKAEALRDRGVSDPAAAAVAAMGDAAEIGEAWNEQLSTFWLWLGRLGWIAMLLMIVAAAVSMYAVITAAADNLDVRWTAPEKLSAVRGETEKGGEELAGAVIDERMVLRDHVVRFYEVSLVETEGETEQGRTALILRSVIYSKNPLLSAPKRGTLQRIACDASEEAFFTDAMRYTAKGGAVFRSDCVWVEEDMTSVEITAEHYGQRFTFTAELEQGGAA